MSNALEWESMSFAERLAVKVKSQESFMLFTRIWFELLQGDRMLINWHHRYMADAIDKVISGQLTPRNLIVNIPPGGTKTEFFSIHLPAYINTLVQCGKLKKFRNLNVSFADTLVKRNSRRTRDIIASNEYQSLWPCSFGINQAEEWEILDSKGRSIGQTVSKASGGHITGGRAGYFGPDFSGCLMFDDINKPADMLSNALRNRGNNLLVNTLRSRRGDKSKDHPTPIISIQQRLHTMDATGFMMGGGMGMKFANIAIPALVSEEYMETLDEPWRSMCWESIKDSECVTRGGVKYWSYWPQMEDIGDLINLWEKDEYTFMSQYMQKPQALTGGMLDNDWYGRYEQLPYLQWRAIYCDTAQKTGQHNDYSVLMHCGLGQDGNLYIIDVIRGKWDSDDLLKTANRVWSEAQPWDHKRPAPLRYLAIEDKSSGTGLIQTLKNQRKVNVRAIPRPPGAGKVTRCLDAQSYIKNGRVMIPHTYVAWDNDVAGRDKGDPINHVKNHLEQNIANTEWVVPFLAESADFAADDSHKHDDMLDCLFDAVADMLISSGGVSLRSIL